MLTEKLYREGQTIADMFNHRIVGRSGTVYTPRSSMIVVQDNDRKRARLEATAARVKVPRDPLADAIDFAGLHKDVLLGLANEEAVDAWADLWSDAVVISSQPWGRFGALRRHAWDLSKPHLPPLLERSLRFDPHRWVLVASGYTDKGLRALLDWSPKSLDLNGGFEEALDDLTDVEYYYFYEEDPEEKHELLLELVRGVERIQYFDAGGRSRLTRDVLDIVLPIAKNLKELFIHTRRCRDTWLENVRKDSKRPELMKATRIAADGLDWVRHSEEFCYAPSYDSGKFSDGKLIVGEELYSFSECLEKAAANPFIDITTKVGILTCQRELLGEEEAKEEAALAVQILEGLLQTRHLDVEELSYLDAHGDDARFVWLSLSNYLNQAKCCVTIGGIVFSSKECLINYEVIGNNHREWLQQARQLLKEGPTATITVKHHLIDDFAASPRTLNYFDCLCCAVFPMCRTRECPTQELYPCEEPDTWLEIATMMKPDDRIRNVFPMKPQRATYSAMDCCGNYVRSHWRRYDRTLDWLALLGVLMKQGDVTATIDSPRGRVNWTKCANFALKNAHSRADAGQVWREVARLVPFGVRFEGICYTKEEMLRHAQELDDARK